MKLTQLASKPQLIKIVLDDEQIQEKYGESLEFWIHDRQPIDKFIKIATTLSTDYTAAVGMLNDLILDETGAPVVQGDLALPNDLVSKVIQKVVEYLGK
jgi:hypothetical protein